MQNITATRGAIIALRVLLALLLLLALALLLLGYRLPGSLFAAVLLSVLAIVGYASASGPAAAPRLFRFNYLLVAVIGLLITAVATVVSLLAGLPPLSALWVGTDIPLSGDIGTPLLFALGVYLTMVGALVQAGVWLLQSDDAASQEQDAEG